MPRPTLTQTLRGIISPAPTSDANSRRSFLRRSAVAAPAILVAGGFASEALAAKKGKRNKNRNNRANGLDAADEFESIRKHENDHVDFLVTALGSAARPKPTFRNLDQPNFNKFAKVAQSLENTGVGAYLGAAPFINNRQFLAAAGTIALVEGRHAGWLNEFLGSPITAPVFDLTADPSFEEPLTAEEVRDIAGTFIADLNGGPPIDYDEEVSDENDIDILNFALALEYLEAEFYNINVSRVCGGV